MVTHTGDLSRELRFVGRSLGKMFSSGSLGAVLVQIVLVHYI